MSQSNQRYSELADVLLALQVALQQAELWETEQPSVKALASSAPFCVDTMRFEQWLRYVLIERFKGMIEFQQPLPERCHISPMVDEAFAHLPAPAVRRVAHVCDALDSFLTRSARP